VSKEHAIDLVFDSNSVRAVVECLADTTDIANSLFDYHPSSGPIGIQATQELDTWTHLPPS
jgi:hypothetical protein